MAGMTLLLACAHISLPAPTPGENVALVFSLAAAPDARPHVHWTAPGPCILVYRNGWGTVPTTLRCGPRWERVEDVWDAARLFRETP